MTVRNGVDKPSRKRALSKVHRFRSFIDADRNCYYDVSIGDGFKRSDQTDGLCKSVAKIETSEPEALLGTIHLKPYRLHPSTIAHECVHAACEALRLIRGKNAADLLPLDSDSDQEFLAFTVEVLLMEILKEIYTTQHLWDI